MTSKNVSGLTIQEQFNSLLKEIDESGIGQVQEDFAEVRTKAENAETKATQAKNSADAAASSASGAQTAAANSAQAAASSATAAHNSSQQATQASELAGRAADSAQAAADAVATYNARLTAAETKNTEQDTALNTKVVRKDIAEKQTLAGPFSAQSLKYTSGSDEKDVKDEVARLDGRIDSIDSDFLPAVKGVDVYRVNEDTFFTTKLYTEQNPKGETQWVVGPALSDHERRIEALEQSGPAPAGRYLELEKDERQTVTGKVSFSDPQLEVSDSEGNHYTVGPTLKTLDNQIAGCLKTNLPDEQQIVTGPVAFSSGKLKIDSMNVSEAIAGNTNGVQSLNTFTQALDGRVGALEGSRFLDTQKTEEQTVAGPVKFDVLHAKYNHSTDYDVGFKIAAHDVSISNLQGQINDHCLDRDNDATEEEYIQVFKSNLKVTGQGEPTDDDDFSPVVIDFDRRVKLRHMSQHVRRGSFDREIGKTFTRETEICDSDGYPYIRRALHLERNNGGDDLLVYRTDICAPQQNMEGYAFNPSFEISVNQNTGVCELRFCGDLVATHRMGPDPDPFP